jgi:hypothetical protein
MRLWFKIVGKIQISFGQYHIAHVLWGGLLMLVGVIILSVFKDKRAKPWAMLFSGAGWGLFIDEVGKFVTKSNDYWFQPAVIYIYVSFMLLFLMYKWLENKQPKTKELEPSTWEKILAKVSKSTYNRIFRRKLVLFGMALYSVYYAVDKIIDSIKILENRNSPVMTELKIGSEVMVGLMFLVGILLIINKKTHLGLKFYKYGLLVSILLTSVFRFYFEQFSAVFGLILDILVYSWVVYYYREKTSI